MSVIMTGSGLEGKLNPFKFSEKVSCPLNKFSFIFIAQHCPKKLLSKKWMHENNEGTEGTKIMKARK